MMFSTKLSSIILLAVAVFTSLYIQNCFCQNGGRGNRVRGQGARNGGRRTGGMHPDVHQAYLDSYQHRPTTQGSPLWAALAPTIPQANDVECFVEIITVQYRGGRCIQLGGNISRPFICQSGEQIEFSPYCHFMAHRANQAAQNAAQNAQAEQVGQAGQADQAQPVEQAENPQN